MPYVTPQSLIDEFGESELIELTDRATPRQYAVDTEVAQRACDRAIAEINGFVGARYNLPLPAVPELLAGLGRDLARYYLYQVEPPKVVQTRYEAARKTLAFIQSGAQPLGLDAVGAAVNPPPLDLPVFSSGQKVFGREDL